MIRSSHGSKLLRRLIIGGVALLIPALAGCEAGNGAPVLAFHPAANGAYGTADSVSLSDVFILGGPDSQPLPAGSSASVFLSVYNGGNSADKLISIDASGTAKSVQLSGGSIAIPARGMTDLEGPLPKVVLRGLSKALSGGQTVNLLLTFQNAGSVELAVPVEARTSYYSSYSPPAPTPSPASTGATPSTSASATPTPSTTP